MAGWGATTFAHGLRRAERGGVRGVGWQPSSYHIKTAVRKKQSGHREGARPTRGPGPAAHVLGARKRWKN